MSLLFDLRQTSRSLRRRPGFLFGAVLTTALGVGAGTAVFSVAEGVLLRPFPYRQQERLVSLQQLSGTGEPVSVSWPDFVDWREQSRSFAAMSAYRNSSLTLLDRGAAESLPGREVTAGYFELLGVEPRLGRWFAVGDDRPGAAATVVLSEGLWQRRFGGDPAVLGRSLRIGGQPHEVVGIAPAAVADFQRNDAWIPLGLARNEISNRAVHARLLAIGRLRPEVTLDAAQREMDAIARRLATRYPDSNAGSTVALAPTRERVVGAARPVLRIAGAAAALLLLVACGNVASLLLARAVARDGELALRAALGAGRLRLARQLLLEALTLALLGGAAGVALGWAATTALVAMRPSLPLVDRVSMNPAVLVFGLLVALVSGLVFGAAPLLRLRLRSLAPRLGSRGDGGAGATRLRGAVVMAQVALSAVLLVGAGLLAQSLVRVLDVPLGFEPDDALAVTVEPTLGDYPQLSAWQQYARAVESNVASLPGVESAGVTTSVPLSGATSESRYWIEGTPLPSRERPGSSAQFTHLSSGAFAALGIASLAGRGFEPVDRLEGAPVAIVDESLARQMAPDPRDAVGKRIAFEIVGDVPLLREVVGVVRQTRHYDLEGVPLPQIYVPLAQLGQNPEDVDRRPPLHVVLRAPHAGDLTAAVRDQVRRVDPRLPIVEARTVRELVAGATSRRRLPAALIGAFAAVTLLLSLVGIYALLAFQVAQGRREIGIRLAIGGRPAAVVGQFLRRGARLAAAGVAVGLVAAAVARQLWSGMLFGIAPDDPWTYAAVGALLLLTTIGAAALPARRAARVDPVRALRSE